MFGCMTGGLLTDRYLRRTGDRKWARRTFGMAGYGLAGVAYLLAALALGEGLPFWAFAGCAMAVGFFNDLIMSPSWATAQDIGRRYAAIVSGAMNMIGNLGAALGILVTGQILKAYAGEGGVIQTSGYVTCFFLYAIVYAAGVGVWLLIDPTKPVVPEPTDATTDDHTSETADW